MLITTLLNRCHHFPGFVYEQARLADEGDSILIPIRPRKGTPAICSGCHHPAAGYDQSQKPRHFEFIGVWGFLVFLVYFMRRVDCKGCGITVEEVPWGMGKHSSTRVYMHFLGHWARKLSWKETAESFHTTWDKVHDSVSYLVAYGLEHRVLGVIRAIGVDEVQYAKGHKYLTLVYQIEAGCIRLLWIGGAAGGTFWGRNFRGLRRNHLVGRERQRYFAHLTPSEPIPRQTTYYYLLWRSSRPRMD
jgi:hypothetical protein